MKKQYLIPIMFALIVLMAGDPGICADFKAVFGTTDNRATEHVLYVGETEIALKAESVPIPNDWIFTKKDNSMLEDKTLYTRQAGVLSTSNTDTNAHAHVKNLVLESFEYSGKMMLTEAEGGIGVTFLSAYPKKDDYYRVRGYTTDKMHFAPHPQDAVNVGEFKLEGTATTNFSPKPNVWFHFKIRVIVEPGGTRTQAMFWDDGKLQPMDWQIDVIDVSDRRYTKGTIGLWSGGPGGKKWADLTLNRLKYISESEIQGVHSFAFSHDLSPGVHTIKAMSIAAYQDLKSQVSQAYPWEYAPEETVIEVTRPSIIKIIVN